MAKKNKVVFVVFHTTEDGADYAVKTGLKEYQDGCDWEFQNRDNFPRPLIIRKIKY